MKALVVSKAFVTGMYRKKLREMADLGVQVVAVAPPEWREGGATQRLEPTDDEGYELIVSPMRWNGHFHVHYYPELSAVMRRVRPDVVHVDEEPYNLATYLGVRAARRLGAASLFFAWQNILRRYPPPFSWMERAVYRAVAGGLAGSEDAAAVLRHKGFQGPVTVVPQFGVDPDAFRPQPEGTRRSDTPFTVGFLNRLIPAKAPLLALRAMTLLPADTRIVMVGDGPMRQEVEEEARRLELGDRFEIRGRVPSGDVPALMHSLHAVVLPSLTTSSWKEQFGRVLIEAMASGVPVVGSDSGEIPQVIGDAGLIVPEGDVQALADTLRRLHDDRALWAELRERGRSRAVERFSHRRIAELTVQAYRQAMTCSSSISSSSSPDLT